MRRYLQSRRRHALNLESVSYRDRIGKKPLPISAPRPDHPFNSLRRSRLVPLPYGPKQQTSDIPEEEEDPSVFVWGNELQVAEVDARKKPEADDSKGREVDFIVGLLEKPRGSGYVQVGGTKCLATLYGPRPLRRSMQYSDESYLRARVTLFTTARHDRIVEKQTLRYPTTEEKTLARFLRRALRPVMLLEAFPKSQVFLRVMIIEDDGGALPAAILASSLALSSSALPCADFATAGKIAMHPGGVIVRDPAKNDEYDPEQATSGGSKVYNIGEVTASLLPNLDQLSCYLMVGKMDSKAIAQANANVLDEAVECIGTLESTMITYALETQFGRKKGPVGGKTSVENSPSKRKRKSQEMED